MYVYFEVLYGLIRDNISRRIAQSYFWISHFRLTPNKFNGLIENMYTFKLAIC